MEFRTTIKLEPSEEKIGYDTAVMFVGSCFSSYIGNKFQRLKMPVIVNPAGTVYNPMSVATTLNAIIDEKVYSVNDLQFNNGKWFSYDHYMDFSMPEREETLKKINEHRHKGSEKLARASFLFVTFGTARVYRHLATDKIVSNCHKIPAKEFSREIISVEEIVDVWQPLIDRLRAYNPGIKVVFSVSPVRHWKDGAHGNQISKSILFLAIEKLIGQNIMADYFPAYEIMMDDLRDYRYYADDMLHPSEKAINYIWNLFSGRYFDKKTVSLHVDMEKLAKAMGHRPQNSGDGERRVFAGNTLRLIENLESRLPLVDFSAEKEYFKGF